MKLIDGAGRSFGPIATDDQGQFIFHNLPIGGYTRVDTDWRVVAACAVRGLVSTFAFGLAPAFQAVRRGPKATRARKVLVSVQVAVSCVLLIMSSCFTRAVQRSFRTEVLFDYAGMTMVDPALYFHNYTPAQARQAIQELAERVRQVAGIDAVSFATIPPLRRAHIEYVAAQELYVNLVDHSYFPMMRLPLLQGRLFGATEPEAAAIGESAARRLWPNQAALGKTCLIDHRTRTVTGVVKDSGVNLMTNPDSVEVYLPIDNRNTGLRHHTGAFARQTREALRCAAVGGHASWHRAAGRHVSKLHRQSVGQYSQNGEGVQLTGRDRQFARSAGHLRTSGVYCGAADTRDRRADGARRSPTRRGPVRGGPVCRGIRNRRRPGSGGSPGGRQGDTQRSPRLHALRSSQFRRRVGVIRIGWLGRLACARPASVAHRPLLGTTI